MMYIVLTPKERRAAMRWLSEMGLEPSVYARAATALLLDPDRRIFATPIVEDGKIVGWEGGPDEIDRAIAATER
jgi:hypothetical protein